MPCSYVLFLLTWVLMQCTSLGILSGEVGKSLPIKQEKGVEKKAKLNGNLRHGWQWGWWGVSGMLSKEPQTMMAAA